MTRVPGDSSQQGKCDPEPSREDIALTRAIADEGAVLQLPVYDHIIVAGSQKLYQLQGRTAHVAL